MSKIGQKPVDVPSNVTINLVNRLLVCLGPKGKLEQVVPRPININLNDQHQIIVSRHRDQISDRMLHGLYRSLIANMVEGVTQGFEKILELRGVGYRAAIEADQLTLWLGYSHPVIYHIPQDVTIEVEKNTRIKIFGIDKQKVGEIAAQIRRFRPPEPYKGRGIRYSDEIVTKKAGKAGKATT